MAHDPLNAGIIHNQLVEKSGFASAQFQSWLVQLTRGMFTTLRAVRLYASGGKALAAADVALHANWGTGAAASVAAKDQGGRISVTSGGAATGADPTVTVTFADGPWTLAPAIACSRGDVAAIAAGLGQWRLTSVSATAAVFTFSGTPNTGTVYVLDFVAMGL